MKNKKVIMGFGALVLAGVVYYLWKKNKKSSFNGEEKSNAQAGGGKTKWCCTKVDGNGKCISWVEVNAMKPCGNAKRVTAADF